MSVHIKIVFKLLTEIVSIVILYNRDCNIIKVFSYPHFSHKFSDKKERCQDSSTSTFRMNESTTFSYINVKKSIFIHISKCNDTSNCRDHRRIYSMVWQQMYILLKNKINNR